MTSWLAMDNLQSENRSIVQEMIITLIVFNDRSTKLSVMAMARLILYVILSHPSHIFLPLVGGPVPYDGIPIVEIVTVALPLTVIYSLCATGGIMFVIVCLLFNFLCRDRK